MFIHNAPGNRQAQPRAVLLGAEERFEESLLRFGGNAAAVVLDLQNHRVGWPSLQRFSSFEGAEGDGPVAPDAYAGVLDQVDEHLFELMRIRTETGIGHRVELQ